jgi:hypothetical protein
MNNHLLWAHMGRQVPHKLNKRQRAPAAQNPYHKHHEKAERQAASAGTRSWRATGAQCSKRQTMDSSLEQATC